MKSIGPSFREKREEKGWSVEEVAQRTKIRGRYIRAMEEENFDAFPAGFYTRGFLRSYADHLGLDPDEVIRVYEQRVEAPDEDGEEERSPDDTTRNGFYWLSLGGVAAVALVLVFFRFAWIHPGQAQVEPAAPNVARSPGVAPSGDAGPHTIPLQNQPDKLKLRVVALEKTWIFVIFDGLEKREMMLQAGEEVQWEAEDTILVRLGNAAGIRLYYRGDPIPKLGEPGEVTDKIITLEGNRVVVRSARLSPEDSGS